MDYMQILHVLLHVDQSLGMLIEQYGTLIYMVLFLIVFCETGLVVFPFLPGDSLLFIAGAFCASGAMNIWVLLAVLIAAAILGNTVNYAIGRMLGERIYTMNSRWINPQSIMKTHAFYEKHGGITLVVARFTPIVRTFAPFIAGVSMMRFAKFQFFNIIGALLWVISLLMCGFLFGHIPFVKDHLNTFVLLGLGTAVLPLIALGVWHVYKKIKPSHLKAE
jgi:membrane-associated protein